MDDTLHPLTELAQKITSLQGFCSVARDKFLASIAHPATPPSEELLTHGKSAISPHLCSLPKIKNDAENVLFSTAKGPVSETENVAETETVEEKFAQQTPVRSKFNDQAVGTTPEKHKIIASPCFVKFLDDKSCQIQTCNCFAAKIDAETQTEPSYYDNEMACFRAQVLECVEENGAVDALQMDLQDLRGTASFYDRWLPVLMKKRKK